MTKDGGPAFPREEYQEGPPRGQAGMSLRDYFAAAALAGVGTGNSGDTSENLAAMCYILADAMLTERAKP